MNEQQISDLITLADAGDGAAAEKLIEMSAEVLADLAYSGEAV